MPLNKKLLKKDLLDLLNRMEQRTEKFTDERLGPLGKIDIGKTEGDLWMLPEMHDLSCQFAQDMVMLMREYKLALREKEERAYHDGGYFQIIKGRNQHTKPFSR